MPFKRKSSIRNQTDLPPGAAEYATGLRKWAPMIVLSLALMIVVLDTTILNVSLKSIVTDLNTDVEGIQWVITAYSLTLAAFVITGGRLGDLFGRKRMFMVGAVIFAIGSFITSISTSISMMIVGEAVICGIGAALMMPATASLLISNYSGRDRALAFGIWGGVAAAASALGPIVGGILTTSFSWRWGFRINIFVVVLLLLGSLLIAESRDRDEKRELDWFGVLLSSTGLFSLVFGVIESSRNGWWVAKETFTLFGQGLNPFGLSITPIAIALGVLILIIFGLWQWYQERHGHTPLVSLSLFANRQFTAGASVSTMLALGQTGLVFALPVFLQSVQNLDALHTGLTMLPMSLTLLCTAPTAGFMSKYFKPKHLAQTGLLVNITATLVLRQALTVDATWTDLAPGLVLYGLGMGLVISQISNLTLSAVSVEESGEAAGVNSMFRQVGMSFGSAIIGAALIASLASNLASGISSSTTIAAEQRPALAAAVSAQASDIEFGGVRQSREVTELAPEQQQELVAIAHEASAAASRRAIIFTTLFAFMALLISTRLPNAMNVERGTKPATAVTAH